MPKKHTVAKASPTTVAARTAPLEQLQQCTTCPRMVPLLVEGTEMCIRCDARYYPELVIA
jgi:hypothetical protein